MVLCEVDLFIQETFLEEDANASYELSTLPSTWKMTVSVLSGVATGSSAYPPFTFLANYMRVIQMYTSFHKYMSGDLVQFYPGGQCHREGQESFRATVMAAFSQWFIGGTLGAFLKHLLDPFSAVTTGKNDW